MAGLVVVCVTRPRCRRTAAMKEWLGGGCRVRSRLGDRVLCVFFVVPQRKRREERWPRRPAALHRRRLPAPRPTSLAAPPSRETRQGAARDVRPTDRPVADIHKPARLMNVSLVGLACGIRACPSSGAVSPRLGRFSPSCRDSTRIHERVVITPDRVASAYPCRMIDECNLAERLISYDTSRQDALVAAAGFVKGWLESREIEVRDLRAQRAARASSPRLGRAPRPAVRELGGGYGVVVFTAISMSSPGSPSSSGRGSRATG